MYKRILISSGCFACQGVLMALCWAQESNQAGHDSPTPSSISGVYENTLLLTAVEDVVRQSGLKLPVSISPGMANKRVNVSFRRVSFDQAIVKLCSLTDCEIAKNGLRGAQSLSICHSLAESPSNRAYAFAHPFSFELSYLSQTASPAEIRNAWRLRFLGLRDDCVFAGVSRVSVQGPHNAKETLCDTIKFLDYRGDIVRTTGGTQDEFFNVPKELARSGFSCKATVNVYVLTEQQWLVADLQAGAHVNGKDVQLVVQEVSEDNDEITVSYVLSWATRQSAEQIRRIREYFARVSANEKMTQDEVNWMKSPDNQIPTFSIREVVVGNRERGQRVSPIRWSQESSNDMEKPALTGKVTFSKETRVSETQAAVLHIFIARKNLRQETLTFDVSGVCNKALDAKPPVLVH